MAATGPITTFGVRIGESVPLGVTYCGHLLNGDIPNVIPSTQDDSQVRDLPATRFARIGAYIGVPLRLSDGTLYGTLCCASHHAEPNHPAAAGRSPVPCQARRPTGRRS